MFKWKSHRRNSLGVIKSQKDFRDQFSLILSQHLIHKITSNDYTT